VPLDTRIPLMAQTYQPDFGEIAQTRAQGMNVLSQMRQRDQELAQQNALAEYVRSGGLTRDPLGALQFGAAGADMLNASTQANRFKLEQDKATREAEQERLETQKKAFGTALMNVHADPSDANADMNFANLEVLGIDTSPYRQMLSQVKDPVERKRYLDDFLNTTEEGRTFLERYESKPEMVDLGNRKVMMEKNRNRDDFGKEIAKYDVGVSPDQQSRERIADADQAAKASAAKSGVTLTSNAAFNKVISQAKTLLDDLNARNAIPSTQKNALENVMASTRASPVGRVIERATGTQAQTTRDEFASLRPLIMSSIKNATGLSSQQLNSNVELQFYIDAIGKQGATYEANLAALNNLSNYVSGLIDEQGGGAGAGAGAGGVTDFNDLTD
jgi:hypothetical protein